MGIRPAVMAACLAWASVAHAQFSVTNTNDAGAGSLRAAITNANSAAGSKTITVLARGTIALQSPLPTATNTLTVTGPGADQLTVQGSAMPSAVFTASGPLTLKAMTIAGGMHAGDNGGGIAASGSSLFVDGVVITGNTAVSGAAIHCQGALTISNSTISANVGTGAIFAAGDTSVVDSTIEDNQGTAIVFPTAGKTLTIDRSTISGNTDDSGIGGLRLQGGTAMIRNSTFSGNIGRQGGDFWTFSDDVTLSLVNVTAANSAAPALLFDHSATVILRNTLFAGPGERCSLDSQPMSQGHNMSSDSTCNLSASTDKSDADSRLAALADNGGTTKTHMPMAGSLALNAGDNVAVDPVDQRGKVRIQFSVVDIGAVEAVEPVITTQPTTPEALLEGGMFTLTVVAMNQDSSAPLGFQWRKGGAPIAGATSATYTKTDAVPDDSGSYDVMVSNDGGSLRSKVVMVTVTATVKPDGAPPMDDDGGGCCSSSPGATSNAALAAAVLGLLGVPRRRRHRR
jgi:predicted outer membrane repeat protein